MSRRLLKNAHLWRWRARALVAAYLEYASLGPSLAALYLDLFEQPAGNRYFYIVLRRCAMRVWIMLGVGALMLVSVVAPNGVWAATIEDVRKEMAEHPTMWHGTRLLMYVPMAGSSNTLVAMTSLCVSGGRLRPIDGRNIDAGPAPQDNQYLVHIVMRDGGGYDIYQYQRKVTLPDCK